MDAGGREGDREKFMNECILKIHNLLNGIQ